MPVSFTNVKKISSTEREEVERLRRDFRDDISVSVSAALANVNQQSVG